MPGTEQRAAWLAVFACFAVALFEGLDIQSMGVAAPRIAPAFGLKPATLGLVLAASSFGLMVGAGVGGWISDRIGRRAVLMASMIALGIFSYATSLTSDFETLLWARVLAGVGLGGVFPNLIALTSEVAPRERRITALGLVYCGMPLGGAFAGYLMSIAPPQNWWLVFQVGGVGPIILVPLLALFVANDRRFFQAATLPRAEIADVPAATLFGARTGATLLLWTSYFFTLMAIYLLLNWLPSLMVAKGLGKHEAAQSAIFLNVGAVIGSLILGRLADSGRLRAILIATYIGMMLSFGGLILANGSALQGAAFVAGFFVIGGQLVLYALAPMIYPSIMRGRGIGAAVAAGRAGSILGPILGGLVLAAGLAANAVSALAEPGLLIALVAVLFLVRSGSLGSGARKLG